MIRNDDDEYTAILHIYTSQIHTLHINSPSLSRVSLALRPPLRKFTARLRVLFCVVLDFSIRMELIG